MKKKRILVLSVILILSVIIACASLNAGAASIFGDINKDGKITAVDARILLRVSAGLETITAPDEDYYVYFVYGDFDFDYKVTAIDARILLMHSAGLRGLVMPEYPTGVYTTEELKVTSKVFKNEELTAVLRTTEKEETTTEPLTEEPTTAEPKDEVVDATPEEILNNYKDVMKIAKKDKPGFKAYSYIYAPAGSADRQVNGNWLYANAVINLLSLQNKNIAEKLGKKDTVKIDKDSSMDEFPLFNNESGCLLSDVSAIKTAKKTKLANGNTRLEITLKEEKNPEPTPAGADTPLSNTGAMFDTASITKIRAEVSKFFDKLKWNDSDIKYDCDITYHDCKATLEYNSNNEIVSLEQNLVSRLEGRYSSTKTAMVFKQNYYMTYRYNCFEF